MTYRVALLSAGLLTGALAGEAWPQSPEGGDGRAAEVNALFACRQIESAAARAACFDSALADFERALDGGEIAIIERRAVREVERDGFGLSLPSLSGIQQVFRRDRGEETEQTTQAGAQDQPRPGPETVEPEVETFEDGSRAEYRGDGRLDRITGAPVASVRDTRDGIVVTLENGQVWRQTDGTRVLPVRRRHLEAGLTAEIERGMLGSYFMTLSHDGRRMRAERIR